MTRIFVLTPLDGRTGGIEALYQLTDALRSFGADAGVSDPRPCDHPPSPPEYSLYDAPRFDFSTYERYDAIVVPEVWLDRAVVTKAQSVVLWWLSFDNAFGLELRGRRFLPLRLRRSYAQIGWAGDQRRKLERLRLHPDIIHAAQSHYALDQLRQHGFPAVMLTDYLPKIFLPEEEASLSEQRDIAYAYNAAKGLDRARPLVNHWPVRAEPLRRLSRDSMISLLSRTEVYFDFGDHPGRDRIPREAACLGCVVVVGTRGAALDPIDMPLDDEYKLPIPGRSTDDLERTRHRLELIRQDVDLHRDRQRPYREQIRSQRTTFLAEAQRLLARIGG